MCFDTDINRERLEQLKKRYQADLDRALANTHSENSALWVEHNTNRLNDLPQPSCANCLYLQTAMRCRLADAVPPRDVQLEGCEAWVFDHIPF